MLNHDVNPIASTEQSNSFNGLEIISYLLCYHPDLLDILNSICVEFPFYVTYTSHHIWVKAQNFETTMFDTENSLQTFQLLLFHSDYNDKTDSLVNERKKRAFEFISKMFVYTGNFAGIRFVFNTGFNLNNPNIEMDRISKAYGFKNYFLKLRSWEKVRLMLIAREKQKQSFFSRCPVDIFMILKNMLIYNVK